MSTTHLSLLGLTIVTASSHSTRRALFRSKVAQLGSPIPLLNLGKLYSKRWVRDCSFETSPPPREMNRFSRILYSLATFSLWLEAPLPTCGIFSSSLFPCLDYRMFIILLDFLVAQSHRRLVFLALSSRSDELHFWNPAFLGCTRECLIALVGQFFLKDFTRTPLYMFCTELKSFLRPMFLRKLSKTIYEVHRSPNQFSSRFSQLSLSTSHLRV